MIAEPYFVAGLLNLGEGSIILYLIDEEEDKTVSSFLQNIALATDQDNEDDDRNKVSLMTIHLAKGLEFPVVIYPFVDSVTHKNSGPDCYGIDMAKMEDFIAFRAAIRLLKNEGKESIIKKTYQDCLKELKLPSSKMKNKVSQIYSDYSDEQISDQISKILKELD